jgi:hypothetical protein
MANHEGSPCVAELLRAGSASLDYNGWYKRLKMRGKKMGLGGSAISTGKEPALGSKAVAGYPSSARRMVR